MRIYVNDVEIDVKLEDERTLADVMNGIEPWLVSGRHALVGVAADGTAIDRDAWAGMPLADIDRLAIEARDLRGERIDGLRTVADYLELAGRVLAHGDDAQLRAVLTEHAAIESGLTALAPDLAGVLESAVEPLRGSGGDASERGAAGVRIEQLRTIVAARIREWSDPVAETRATLPLLDEIVRSFEHLPGMLQTGGGAEAMLAISRFAELAARIVRMLPLLALERPALPEETARQTIAAINEQLSELEAAFDAGDYVLIGDVLEYELMPRFQELAALLAGAL